MRRSTVAVCLVCAATFAAAQQAYAPGPQNIELPKDYQERFIRYAAVDKPDRKIVRFLYANPESLAAAKAGQPLPYGTVLIMEDHPVRLDAAGQPMRDQQDRLMPLNTVSGLFLQEKRLGWGVGYGPEKRNGEWEYARFNPDGSRHPGALDGCFACHLQQRPTQDFAFNFWDYIQTKR
jgi:hemoglobin